MKIPNDSDLDFDPYGWLDYMESAELLVSRGYVELTPTELAKKLYLINRRVSRNGNSHTP